jgi:SAM-dependent methyltransferase
MINKIKNIYSFALKAAKSTLVNDEIRFWVGHGRFKKYKANIKILQAKSSKSVKNVTEYNLKAFDNIKTDFLMRRMKWLIFSALATETTSPDNNILVIGPRTENEILFLKGLGYNNVQGVDLISYSPWVKLGDMHNMPFPKSSFDVVLCGWTLPYSKIPQKVALEILRVTKQDGIIAVGLEHIPEKTLKKMKINFSRIKNSTLNPREIAHKRLNSCEDILGVFKKQNISEIYFRHDAPLKKVCPKRIQKISGLASSQVMICFRKK